MHGEARAPGLRNFVDRTSSLCLVQPDVSFVFSIGEVAHVGTEKGSSSGPRGPRDLAQLEGMADQMWRAQRALPQGHYIWSDGSEFFGEFHEASAWPWVQIRPPRPACPLNSYVFSCSRLQAAFCGFAQVCFCRTWAVGTHH